MTYLATEILLYLLSAAVIGLILGWLLWGAGSRRKLNAMRNDLTAKIRLERQAHQESKRLLDQAEVRKIKAVEAAKVDADRKLAELRQSIEVEHVALQEAQGELERLRGGMTVEGERILGQETIDQAIEAANAEKAIAAEAVAQEAQLRAQLEELRLLIGAEKLAAESARNTLEGERATMRAELAAERSAHEQVKAALTEIRSTLAQTLGVQAPDLDSGGPVLRGAETTGAGAAIPSAHAREGGVQPDPGRGQAFGFSSSAAGRSGIPAHAPSGSRSYVMPFSSMTDIKAAGDALNNPDMDEADIEDREDPSLDLPTTIDMDRVPESDPASASNQGDEPEPISDHAGTEIPIEVLDPPPAPMPEPIDISPIPDGPAKPKRPAVLLDQRPAVVDDLQAINGVSAEVERRLNDCGCYRHHQIAQLDSDDVAWLAEAIDVSANQIASDQWVQQAKALRLAADGERARMFIAPEGRENAAE